jgi:hypothetical protein
MHNILEFDAYDTADLAKAGLEIFLTSAFRETSYIHLVGLEIR